MPVRNSVESPQERLHHGFSAPEDGSPAEEIAGEYELILEMRQPTCRNDRVVLREAERNRAEFLREEEERRRKLTVDCAAAADLRVTW